MQKLSNLFIVLLFVSLFYGCQEPELCPQITIPETDNIPPQYTLSINGPGIGQTIGTREGWTGGQLTLFAGGVYTFVFSASDQGGARIIRMQTPIDLSIIQLNPDNATSRDLGPFSKLLELTNNIEAPTSCLILSGKFRTTEDTTISGRISFFASDYGGATGTRNSTTRDVTISFTDELSEVEFVDF